MVDVMVLCLSKEEAYEGTYIIADKEILSISEVLTYMSGILGVKPPFHIPEGAAKILMKLPVIGGSISSFRKDRFFSIERLEKKFGYIPRVSVYDGLKQALLPYKKGKRGQTPLTKKI